MHLDTMDRALSAALAAGDLIEFERLAQIADRQQADRAKRLEAVDALSMAAPWYARHGIAVFPLQPRTKVPLHGSRGFKDATTDPATVERWWRQHPQANIGMPTGARWDVIDIDGPLGYASLASMKDEGIVPDILARAWTPRGGQHLYIQPTGDGNAASLRPGVDYRGTGGYVVLPPSVGPNGLIYDWITPPEYGDEDA